VEPDDGEASQMVNTSQSSSPERSVLAGCTRPTVSWTLAESSDSRTVVSDICAGTLFSRCRSKDAPRLSWPRDGSAVSIGVVAVSPRLLSRGESSRSASSGGTLSHHGPTRRAISAEALISAWNVETWQSSVGHRNLRASVCRSLEFHVDDRNEPIETIGEMSTW